MADLSLWHCLVGELKDDNYAYIYARTGQDAGRWAAMLFKDVNADVLVRPVQKNLNIFNSSTVAESIQNIQDHFRGSDPIIAWSSNDMTSQMIVARTGGPLFSDLDAMIESIKHYDVGDITNLNDALSAIKTLQNQALILSKTIKDNDASSQILRVQLFNLKKRIEQLKEHVPKSDPIDNEKQDLRRLIEKYPRLAKSILQRHH